VEGESALRKPATIVPPERGSTRVQTLYILLLSSDDYGLEEKRKEPSLLLPFSIYAPPPSQTFFKFDRRERKKQQTTPSVDQSTIKNSNTFLFFLSPPRIVITGRKR
jgi:hypothetical protein